MEIIEKLPDDRFDTICDAGVELMHQLINVLQKFGLGPEEAGPVIAVAAAGVATGSRISSTDVREMVDSAIPMWREQQRDGKRGVIFDPAHRRPGYVPQGRDSSSEN